jgi:Ca-activated chloride channel family protein
MFLWPWVLILLLLFLFLPGLYRRRRKAPAQAIIIHADTTLIALAKTRQGFWRHWPALCYVLALALALVALARPILLVPEAHPQAGIMLALDVSRSMQARDVLPNRFEAARAALKSFVEELPEGSRVGLVTFAGYAIELVPLTADHDRLLEAVDRLYMDFGTVIGEAMLLSLKGLPSLAERQSLGDEPQRFATIILLSDGRSFGGVEPLVALEEVKKQQVTIHTIGVGSLKEGHIPGIPERFQFAARFDEETLRTIAEETGGSYAFVDSAAELKEVYRHLSRSLAWHLAKDEATALASLLAGLLLFLSLGLGAFRRRLV